MKQNQLSDISFFGNKASEQAIEKGYLDLETFSKAFDHVLQDEIMNLLSEKGFYFEQIQGTGKEEIFQHYIVNDYGAEIIQEWSNYPLFYCEDLDLYIWGVTAFGSSWDCVLTQIELNVK